MRLLPHSATGPLEVTPAPRDYGAFSIKGPNKFPKLLESLRPGPLQKLQRIPRETPAAERRPPPKLEFFGATLNLQEDLKTQKEVQFSSAQLVRSLFYIKA